MSYARFGDSDVYIYETRGGIECAGCSLQKGIPITPYIDRIGITHSTHFERVIFNTARGILLHILDHREAGDWVTYDADFNINEAHPDIDAIIFETEEQEASHARAAEHAREIMQQYKEEYGDETTSE